MAYELDSEIRSRLIRYYQQVSDKELLDAAATPDDLTPTAQEVVHAELSGRGLQQAWSNSSDTASQLPTSSQTAQLPEPEFGQSLERGKTALITFYDAIEAGTACDALDAAEIPLEVKDLSQTEGQSSFYGGNPVALQLIVGDQDRERAVKLLRDKMGLFPVEEIAEPEELVDDGTVAIVGQFAKRSDAEDVARVLTEAKIWNRITPNRDGSAATEDAFLVEVREVDLFDAGELVEKALNLPEA